MRVLAFLFSVMALPAAPSAQVSLSPKQIQHVTVVASASTETIARGAIVNLLADVTPNPGIHVYAAGAKDFTPVALVMTPRPGVQAMPVKYPAVERPLLAPADMAPAYHSAFRISQQIRVTSSVKAGEPLTVGAVLTYQACDDNLCYPVTSLPVSWTLTVR